MFATPTDTAHLAVGLGRVGAACVTRRLLSGITMAAQLHLRAAAEGYGLAGQVDAGATKAQQASSSRLLRSAVQELRHSVRTARRRQQPPFSLAGRPGRKLYNK